MAIGFSAFFAIHHLFPFGPRSMFCLRLSLEKKPCSVVKADRAVGADSPCCANGDTIPAKEDVCLSRTAATSGDMRTGS